MARQITLIPGDGIGPEVAEATLRAVEATGVDLEWERVEAGAKALEDLGQLLPDDVFASLECTRVGLKGPTATPIGGGHPSINVALRKKLGLYVNFRPVRMLPGLKTRFSDLALDLAIFRENTEDLYSGIEHEVIPDVVESLKIITKTASMKIARAAFEYARREGRRKVTAIHKANIMKMSDGLFLKCCRAVAGEYGEIEYTELIVDNACMQLVMRPETFDVLVLPNLYGDIVSDLAAGLVGGLGIVPGANIGDRHAIFEAVHGTAPDIAGKGMANPTALMQSAALMLAHIRRAGGGRKAARCGGARVRGGPAPDARCGRHRWHGGVYRRGDSCVSLMTPSTAAPGYPRSDTCTSMYALRPATVRTERMTAPRTGPGRPRPPYPYSDPRRATFRKSG
jgi:isocitrate dehydrogenase (NAD+)